MGKIKRTLKRTVFLIVIVGLAVPGILSSTQPVSAKKEYMPFIPQEATSVSSDYSASCGIKNGDAYCWGSNAWGALGTGDSNGHADAQKVDKSGVLAGKTVTSIGTGGGTTCAIASGKVYCWGRGDNGQLGNGINENSNVPVAVAGTSDLSSKVASSIFLGGARTCVLAEGSVYCWGESYLGVEGSGESNVPIAVSASGVLAGKNVTQLVYTGNSSTTCVLADNQIYCWGSNSLGNLGRGAPLTDSEVPVPIIDSDGVFDGKTITKIQSLGDAMCAIASGKVYCWGNSWTGQWGDGSARGYVDGRIHTVDMTGVLAGKTVTDIASMAGSACVIAEGDVYCWGDNTNGALTMSSDTPRIASPVAIDLGGRTVTSITGTNGYCAVTQGDVYCWGAINSDTSDITSTPLKLDIPGDDQQAVVVEKVYGTAGQKICVLTSEDTVYCRGQRDHMTPFSPELRRIEIITSVLPEISRLDVNNADVGQDNVYTYLYGVDFDEGATIEIGGMSADIIARYDEFLYIKIPVSSTAGSFDVTITNSDGKTGVLQDGFTYNPFVPLVPNITSINPTSSYINNSANYLNIKGDGLSRGNTLTPPKVYIGGNEASFLYALVDPSTGGYEAYIYQVSSVDAPGVVDIVVENMDGQSQTIIDGYTFLPIPEKKVSSASFSDIDGRKALNVSGEALVGMTNPGEYAEALTRSLVTLNGEQLPFCSRGIGASAAEIVDGYGVPANLVSDDPTCYVLLDSGAPAITAERAIVLLADDFDITAQGTVSVNGSNTFTFNQQTTPGNEIADPTVIVGNKSLETKPTINKRPTFSGTAEPGATLTVTVRSDPITCTTTADSNGNWSCTLPSDLPPGDHTVTVRVVNPDNSIVELGPYAVTVTGSGAGVATPATPLAPNTGEGRLPGLQNNHISYSVVGLSIVFALIALVTYTKQSLSTKRPRRTNLKL
ncbi:hypothetical protein EON76_05585 [bacterium]|nr:MAG: hypothetical protein EON76_05585 [bacterium]